MMLPVKRSRGCAARTAFIQSARLALPLEENAVKIALLATMVLLPATAASAQKLVPPEVVQLENVQVEGDTRTVYVGNANNHYFLYCSIKAPAGCITPEENKNYLLFNANTRWKMPGAKDFITLAFIQDWTVKYAQGENIGLVLETGQPLPGELGLFILRREAATNGTRSSPMARLSMGLG